MDRRRHLLLSPALLAVLALGATAGSQSAVAPVSARAVAANIPQGRGHHGPRGSGRQAEGIPGRLQKGLLRRRKGLQQAGDFLLQRIGLGQKGLGDGYNAGHADLCGKTS